MSANPATPSGLTVEGLQKRYGKGAPLAVDGVSFDVPAGEFFTLLGPSGCGKTTTMRSVAGLERPDGGVIRIGGSVVSGRGRFVPTEQRPIGMVFQSYAIWPHMTVFENVAFPLLVARPRTARADVARRVTEALDLVDLGHLGKRSATLLSGGQQQRIALARALVRRPNLLLLDEPLSNLDAKLRERLREEIRDLQRELGITTLYVTHDQAEALSMSDAIAVMEAGKIAQLGTPTEIYQRPATAFVASFVGTSNFLFGTVFARESGGFTFEGDFGGSLRVEGFDEVAEGASTTIAIRPEAIRLRAVDSPRDRPNLLVGVVQSAMFLGERVHCRVLVGERHLVAYTDPDAGIRSGDAVLVEIPPAACNAVGSQDSALAERDDVNTELVGVGEPIGAERNA